MALLHGERRQTVMFPASIDQYVAADDPVRAYDAFVEQLDFAALGIAWDPDRVGAPEYDPKAIRSVSRGCCRNWRAVRRNRSIRRIATAGG
jgi:hypothetical protein